MMRGLRCVLCAVFLALAGAAVAADKPAPVSLDLRSVAVAEVVQLVYGDALAVPYVLDPRVLEDKRLVSVRFDSAKGDFRAWWPSFLQGLGYAVETRAGVDFVGLRHESATDTDVMVYRPKYRDASYLGALLSPLVGREGALHVGQGAGAGFTDQRLVGASIGARSGDPAPPGTAAAMVDRQTDVLIYQGTKADIARLQKLLPQIDVAEGEVMISAVVYEVSTGKQDGSAFSLALNLLGGRLGVQLGGKETGDAVTIKTGTIDAALSVLSGDSRFKVVSSPRVRVRSGGQGRLVVGQDVPTLGAVTYGQAGAAPVQSVEYRSSGVILDMRPVVREGGIDVQVSQQISDFGVTQTGVNGSPTLTKRELSTSVSMGDGEMVVIGGLKQDKGSSSASGQSWLPSWFHTRSASDSSTEVLLLMQVKRL